MSETQLPEIQKQVEPTNTQYQYSYVDMEEVISNPNEYIIPECLPACASLWDKNIETFMVSNNEDDHLYVLMGNLSDDNVEIIEHLIESDSRYFFDGYRKTLGFKVRGKSDLDIKELKDLTNPLNLQDTVRFQSEEDFLHGYKKTGGKSYIDLETGEIGKRENPELVNARLEDALNSTNKNSLYVSEEHRIYQSSMYLAWHQRYQQTQDTFK